MKHILFSISLVLTFALSSVAKEHHPLDKQMEQCVEKNASTYGMMNCSKENYKQWDLELNKYYLLLGGNQNQELRQAQLAWIKFRDLEFKRIEKKYQLLAKNSGGGTIWGLMAGGEKVDFIKRRVLQLIQDHKQLTCGMEC